MTTGTVRWFNPDTNEGTIVDEEGGEFAVHGSKVLGDAYPVLRDGQKVEFEPAQGQVGPVALQVKVIA